MNIALVPQAAGKGATGFACDFLHGMGCSPKRVPSKHLYDAAGAKLFERICELPEYYQTRAELSILRAHAPEIAALMGRGIALIEFGAGNPRKARLLLSALRQPQAYIPVDLCPPSQAVFSLETEFGVAVRPIVADFTADFALPRVPGKGLRLAGFFPGSTIGNFTPEEALSFLRSVRARLAGGGLLVGLDLEKDPRVLHAAYNDSLGVTAAFNRNLLVRANRELGADFDIAAFDHYAPYNVQARRIEMYLVSRRRQHVTIAGRDIRFAEGEAVNTEISCKYTLESFRAIAGKAGFAPAAIWTDARKFFAVAWLEAA